MMSRSCSAQARPTQPGDHSQAPDAAHSAELRPLRSRRPTLLCHVTRAGQPAGSRPGARPPATPPPATAPRPLTSDTGPRLPTDAGGFPRAPQRTAT
ncbi:hypothetical protein NN561_020256 [Cricetulus griseus]